MTLDHQAVAELIAEVAAQEILPRFKALRDHEVYEKQSGELVTVADVATEKALTRHLSALLPGSLVVGEEAVADDPTLLECLEQAAPVWLIDPIDGTANFAAGKPVFAVMVALVREGETLSAWIHDPVADRMLSAERGGGAWLAGRRLLAAAAAAPAAMRGTLHASAYARPEIARLVQARRDRVGAIRSLRCAGHEYLRLAEGHMHFSLFTRLMPWDHAPGSLIHEEAGGVARTLDGARYRATSYRARGLLLAPDESSWQSLHDTLFGANTGA